MLPRCAVGGKLIGSPVEGTTVGLGDRGRQEKTDLEMRGR